MKTLTGINHVATENISVSGTTGTGIDGCILTPRRIHRTADGREVHQRADHHGRQFASRDEAWQFAFEHGYIREYFTSAGLRARKVARGTGGGKRFVVLGGPGGRLTCRPAGCPMITDRYRRWQPLFTVNRPLTTALADAAKSIALRDYEVV